eukprot:TRINITY_DN5378_c0_g3_i1.p1 TRINITY_DN5378_c0_g3~~TRINITY_DN5378_c0_g3_i1.p1  ORF type:complete len:187 (-),score=22.36 TRINITY_DN5378_c0_g3_i1:84-644(-)
MRQRKSENRSPAVRTRTEGLRKEEKSLLFGRCRNFSEIDFAGLGIRRGSVIPSAKVDRSPTPQRARRASLCVEQEPSAETPRFVPTVTEVLPQRTEVRSEVLSKVGRIMINQLSQKPSVGRSPARSQAIRSIDLIKKYLPLLPGPPAVREDLENRHPNIPTCDSPTFGTKPARRVIGHRKSTLDIN